MFQTRGPILIASVCEVAQLGVYSIDIGMRQMNRYDAYFNNSTIYHVDELSANLRTTIAQVLKLKKQPAKIISKRDFENNLKEIFNDDFFNVDIRKVLVERNFDGKVYSDKK